MYDEHIQIKQERETDGSELNHNFSEDSSDVPMNLTNEQSRKMRDELNSGGSQTAVVSQFNGDMNDSVKNKLKQKISASMPETMEPSYNIQGDNQYVYCKKVRQAQQLKMSANATSTSTINHFQENPVMTSAVTSSEVVHEMLMPSKIPSKRRSKRDFSMLNKKFKYPEDDESADQTNESPINQVEPNDLVKKDDLKEDFILPRERFISICNMDRNALDTYLNPNEENSQDLELLQYFGEDKNKNVDCVQEDLGPASTSVPLLENYQLFSEGKNTEKNYDKISQLRSMLEEKYSSAGMNNVNNDSVIKNLLQKNCHQTSIELNNCEQTNSYGSTQNTFLNSQPRQPNQQPNMSQNLRPFPVDVAAENEKFVPQSPNTRRKNFSFVPIPAQSSRAKNINSHPVFKADSATSPFVSPRATPVNRRGNTFLNIRNPNMSVEPKPIPVLGVNNTAFCRPHSFKMEPASAPQSPLMPQNYNYSPQHQQNQFQFQPLNQGPNYNYPVESRSQSVPPHCTNNNMFNNFNSYSSACSSVAQTPVPSDYQEFSDSNILDIFNNEQASSTIKLEASDDVIDLLDNEILNQNSAENQSLRQTYVNSRSVPNTPLPYHVNYNNMNSFCPVGKSVPNTPIANNTNPFRYSPELQRTRDFLINGFNNNNNNNNSVINHNTEKITKNDESELSADIDELSNLDTSLLNSL